MAIDRRVVASTVCAMVSSNDLYEYFYCPREVYFMKKLRLPSEKRKMQMGREEQEREVKRVSERNDVFGISREDVAKIEQNKYLESKDLDFCGIMDVLLTLNDGEMVPVDIKYTAFPHLQPGRVKQIIGYALLIDRNYDKNTCRGIIYYPMQNKQDTVKVSPGDKSMLLMDIERIKRIILSDKVPRKTASKNCGYCGYLKICGSFD